jgi:hypothetical protein
MVFESTTHLYAMNCIFSGRSQLQQHLISRFLRLILIAKKCKHKPKEVKAGYVCLVQKSACKMLFSQLCRINFAIKKTRYVFNSLMVCYFNN